MNRLLNRALRLRSRPGIFRLERAVRGALPPLDRVLKRTYRREKERTLARVTTDKELMRLFRDGGALPAGYGAGMDERVVEYPWLFSKLASGPAAILDAGSTLNFEWIERHPLLADKQVVLYTLAPEGVIASRRYSYVYGDLRSLLLRDASMDTVVCVSTLEHVGMNNARYTGSASDVERGAAGMAEAVREFARVLKPGGWLLLTVPFGLPVDLGWLRQFDAARLDAVSSAFGAPFDSVDFFRHDALRGWQRADAAGCADATYLYDESPPGRPVRAMAEAVACARLTRV